MGNLLRVLGTNLGLASDILVNGNLVEDVYDTGTSRVWILSSALPQPIYIRGIWIDTSTWSDIKIWYD